MNRFGWNRFGWTDTRARLLGSAALAAIGTCLAPAGAYASIQIPAEPLPRALEDFGIQSGLAVIADSRLTANKRSHGVNGVTDPNVALAALLRGTGLTYRRTDGAVMILAAEHRAAQAAPAPMAVAPMAVETVVVTAQKKQENIQQVPISVTALSQKDLTDRQIAAGPDLLHDVPNMNFGKTNFSGYSIELRGIGTQAISVTTDPAVAVAFNDIPFIRNHFFEQEFFDLADAEVLRGPQGTLYGRNATAGVVNLKSALPTDSYEAMLSADMGNYSNRRLEGMLNLPLDGDKLDLRIAGEWTKRDGYSFNTITNEPIDGRDLWSGRVTLGWKPASNVQTYLIWEHFSEDDDRLRSGKQLCKYDPIPASIGGTPIVLGAPMAYDAAVYLSQGCSPTSLYSPSAFEVPNGYTLPYYEPLGFNGVPITASVTPFDPYASTTQSTNLRDIESTINPTYRAKNDTLEFNVNYGIAPGLTLTSQTGYNHDYLWSSEDYNRFDTAPGAFDILAGTITTNPFNALLPDPLAGTNGVPSYAGVFCDPQLGCSDRLVAEDLDVEHAWQFSQELRLASNFSGPFNFNVGGNYLHYETEENYYVFINSLTLAEYTSAHRSVTLYDLDQTQPWVPGVSDNANCMAGGYAPPNPNVPNHLGVEGELPCGYLDPNPITSLNNEGHNYFLSQNPYVLNSYALFGESYYDITNALKLTAGLRWTDDQKNFIDIPSELLEGGYGYPVSGVVNQSWQRFTGRTVLDWTPQLDFTDQTLVYASYAHGYKAGGANPPGAELLVFGDAQGGTGVSTPIHPLTFKPEYIEAFELGTKNTLLDGSLTLNGDVFYYNYTGYQISEIVDRTAINNNYNAHVEGAEVEANWEPLPGLKFNFAGGWEDTAAAGGDSGIDLMDRTAGNPGWMVVKPFVSQASNCILPTYVVAASVAARQDYGSGTGTDGIPGACSNAYQYGLDPVTLNPYVPNPVYPTGYKDPQNNPGAYPGFNPLTAPNDGEGFSKNLGGHQLPNAPPFTVSFGAEYSMPVSQDWVGTLRADYYWQDESWARIFNDNPYDKLFGYTDVNLALILTSDNGWQVMGYVKNVFNVTAITGDFLNSDDSGLTTNVFLTDPRLFGVRVTKQLDQNDGFWGSDYSGYEFFTDLFSDTDNGKPPLWIELGGQLSVLDDSQAPFAPPLMEGRPSIFAPSQKFEGPPRLGFDQSAALSFEPGDSGWVFSASIQYGRAKTNRNYTQQTNPRSAVFYLIPGYKETVAPAAQRFADTTATNSEQHAIIDFQAGKDVGLGLFGGPDASSLLSLGVRFAQFSSRSNFTLKSDPDFRFIPHFFYFSSGFPNVERMKQAFHSNLAGLNAKRSFHGVGPSVSWKSSIPVAGHRNDGELSADWGLNGALLFGRQRAQVHHQSTARYAAPAQGNYAGFYNLTTIGHFPATPNHTRSRIVTVPNIGAFAAISYRLPNAKISFGYRADEFFGAMDGGIDTRKSENVGFFGPYANISIGLGG